MTRYKKRPWLILGGLLIAAALGAPARAAAPAAGGTMLVASDLHFDPMADPALVDALVQAEPASWEAIFTARARKSFSPYGKDTDWALLHSALSEMRRVLPQPSLVIVPGDFLAHNFRLKFDAAASLHGDEAYRRFVHSTIAFLALQLRQAFPDAPILAAIGNNDDECGDYEIAPGGPFLDDTAEIARRLARAGDDPAFRASWRADGDYALPHPMVPGLEILAVNSVFFSSRYDNACGTPDGEPARQVLAWLDRRLAAVAAAHGKAWLVYHIPPGVDAYATLGAGRVPLRSCAASIAPMWRDDAARSFEALMAKYSGIVAAGLVGHTHMDEFRLLGPPGRPDAFAFSVPAISPIFGQNPGFRTIAYDAQGGFSDATTYYLANPAEAGATVQADWREEYDFDRAWGVDRIDRAALQQLRDRIAAGGAAEDRWASYYALSSPANRTAAAPAGRRALVCAIGNASTLAYQACYCGDNSAPAGPAP